MRRVLGRWLSLLPALLLLGGFAGAVLLLVLQSFGYAPVYGFHDFPTAAYYQRLLQEGRLLRYLGYTLAYALPPTVVAGGLSIPLALALRHVARKRWNGWQRLYQLPLFVPYLVSVALVLLLWSNGGLLARVAYQLGLIETTRDFPRIVQSASGWGVMLAYFWKQLPFCTLLLGQALNYDTARLESAARCLGARPLQVTMHITLPRLLPHLIAATSLCFAYNVASFEVPFILSNQDTLAVWAYRTLQRPELHYRLEAAAILSLLSLLTLGLLLLYVTAYRRVAVNLS